MGAASSELTVDTIVISMDDETATVGEVIVAAEVVLVDNHRSRQTTHNSEILRKIDISRVDKFYRLI